MSTVLLIPIYEPTEKTVVFMKKLSQKNFLTLVVDDGSGDTYRNRFQQITDTGATVLSYPVNHGKGYALKYGLNYIQKNYPMHHVVTADGDGQHTLTAIEQMMQHIDLLQVDVFLLGVRHFDKQTTPKKSYYGNRITSLIYYLSSGIRLEDTQTGLRGFHANSIPELLTIPGERFDYEMNQLIDLIKEGYSLETIDIETIYENNNEHSHFRAVQDSYLVYRPLLLFLLSSLSSALVDVTIFLILAALFGNQPIMLFIATVGARILSGLFNFQFNRKLVFKDHQQVYQSLGKYLLLFCSQLVLSWLGVMVFSTFIQSIIISKLLVDCMLFFISFSLQRRYVFH